jgi:predicted Zn-dependent protease
MFRLLRGLVVVALTSLAVAVHAAPLTYEPVALGWSADEVEQASLGQWQATVQRAAQTQRLGCERHCERIERVFQTLLRSARAHSVRARDLAWSLTVVRLDDVEALALPGGQVVISEGFVERRARSDAALAFVLAHEMAHSMLEHERQALTYARLLLPRHVPRTVRDMYTEMDFNMGLLKAMEPVLQQGEFEADELGLLLASVAGYAPDAQMHFIEEEARQDPGRPALVATHPPAAARLDQLTRRLPLARRMHQSPQVLGD